MQDSQGQIRYAFLDKSWDTKTSPKHIFPWPSTGSWLRWLHARILQVCLEADQVYNHFLNEVFFHADLSYCTAQYRLMNGGPAEVVQRVLGNTAFPVSIYFWECLFSIVMPCALDSVLVLFVLLAVFALWSRLVLVWNEWWQASLDFILSRCVLKHAPVMSLEQTTGCLFFERTCRNWC